MQAADTLRSALELWRGPALADVAYEPFAQAEIARLEALRAAATEKRIDADLACGRHAELIELESLVAQHPLWERLRSQLMLALYRSGRRADALAAYRRRSANCRRARSRAGRGAEGARAGDPAPRLEPRPAGRTRARAPARRPRARG